MYKNILYVFLGSGIGGACRYLLHFYVKKIWDSTFPLGTFIINVLGCWVIGAVYGIASKTNIISPSMRLFLTTGICGGFTTYSAFMLENYTLLQSQNYLQAIIYVTASLFVGYAAVVGGALIVKFLI
jgi:fluoride exporter